MTVKELIEALSQYPEDMNVAYHINGSWQTPIRVSEAMLVIPNFDNGKSKTIKFIGID